MKAASKQLTKSAYPKKCFKKKVKKEAKQTLKGAIIGKSRGEIIAILVNEAGVSQYDIEELDEEELLELAYAAANYDDDN